MPHHFHLTTQTMYQNKEEVNMPNRKSCLDEIVVKILLALVSSDGGNGGKYV